MNRKRLRAKVHTINRSQTTNYATIIDVAPGKVTVKIAGNGAKLTMIPCLLADPSVGEIVILDFSGTVPLVKAKK